MKIKVSFAIFFGIYQILFAQLTDVEGKKYSTAKFGSQVWMLENLNVSKFRNGDIIKQVKSTEEWEQATKNGEPVWCYYENRAVQSDPVNGSIYGKLYNWHAIKDSRGLSPKGWHVPSFDEWTILFNFVGGIENSAYKLKSKDSWEPFKDWDLDLNKSYTIKAYTGGINYLGFNALPGGYISNIIGFNESKGIVGSWWSTTENYSFPNDINYDIGPLEKEGINYSKLNYEQCQKDQILIIKIYHSSDAVKIDSDCKFDGYSVRCVKD